ncbi:hypothetical protein MO767_18510 [Pseudomonas sp. UYIF39]|uniref:hypothetical protein n=1 Tax=Pseudomonas sp. UYIF39 TaxID=1630747 RepID=UPI00249DBCF9|nr:hypothetical protein [Pseudomonas sp. UYIF39]MDI3356328.1 hypothetical protein [Pseudomonas sp. UYIF39]
MSIPKTPKQRQKTRRDNLKLAGVIRMTVAMDIITVHILRSLAVEHRVTQSEVLEMGMTLARNALKEFAGRQLPCICSLAPVEPVAVLADQVCQFAQLQVEDELDAKACPRMTAAEVRDVSLFGTHSPEMFEVRP